ncbi:GNAT family N-acetyltransferase [Nocardioides sp. SYSU DS0663]|uniref:GNAT family N-acetyltransferase n=1 Tax=Nocardioides sp. SYSU DS0663 TaxID=3416445 RepID=UPI003F4C94F4
MPSAADIVLSVVDPADEPSRHAWWAVGESASRDRAYDAWPSWGAAGPELASPRTDTDVTLVLAVDAQQRPVGAGRLTLSTMDNPHLAEVEVYVAPDARRQGVGSAVLADLEERAVVAGRTTALGTTYAPVGAESAGSLFCAARGYPVASHEETKLLDLGTAPATWPALDDEVARHLGGYTVVGFEDVVPEAYVEDFCALLCTFLTMIPTGDVDFEDEVWTPERLHEHERHTAASGRTWIVALALTPEGRACGFTEVGISRAEPRMASVGGTMVAAEHRGHRLGLAMKMHNHRRLLELFPGCQHVETGNAGVNAAMNAVNEALGYRVVERSLDVQKRLAPAGSRRV